MPLAIHTFGPPVAAPIASGPGRVTRIANSVFMCSGIPIESYPLIHARGRRRSDNQRRDVLDVERVGAQRAAVLVPQVVVAHGECGAVGPERR